MDKLRESPRSRMNHPLPNERLYACVREGEANPEVRHALIAVYSLALDRSFKAYKGGFASWHPLSNEEKRKLAQDVIENDPDEETIYDDAINLLYEEFRTQFKSLYDAEHGEGSFDTEKTSRFFDSDLNSAAIDAYENILQNCFDEALRLFYEEHKTHLN